MAASEDGKLLFWGSPFDKAQIIKAEVSGRFIDMDSFADRCYAVTDRSEIVTIGLSLPQAVAMEVPEANTHIE